MRFKPIALPLPDLGITKTDSRPSKSDDNAFFEYQYKRLRYDHDLFDCLGCLADRHSLCQGFFPKLGSISGGLTKQSDKHKGAKVFVGSVDEVHWQINQSFAIILITWRVEK